MFVCGRQAGSVTPGMTKLINSYNFLHVIALNVNCSVVEDIGDCRQSESVSTKYDKDANANNFFHVIALNVNISVGKDLCDGI